MVMLVGKEIFPETKKTEKCTAYSVMGIAPVTSEWMSGFLIEERLVLLCKMSEAFCEEMAMRYRK